ncbi:LysR substrate-binding domain-containing protein [Streptomyces stelliscabiei]|uniref:DNA-binding transcriptional LysR family regulator n=1 Tax=Streptomyces stelliscabiei TaxID=146820 RepID=A0A8I0P0A1_9ACTN|nr:LysR substrate-binding domain-containing protein [Streptomyces stelliscabiei]KND43517.1 LysR family transcriptional regulator [Streptomyces stelliscabiei]MBE1595795.1 DNA-binding transcriptional LysR family regulator [Streptomyces stelliscabiei]MDX2517810.1 LysR substrate-binding domain-containing protein [Streptomyces stelliscabiei]MDX2555622.1 LysR substrate-binding domain-containing protein [Streptomyces stelliscabiei]MDX2614141.1 LysR substrate-binding domain-containing protein [Strepto
MTGSEASPSFRLAYVPGVTPTKWVRIWNERLPDVPLTLLQVSPAEAFGLLRDGGADAGFVRLPVDRDDLSAIPLYTETTVVVVPQDHVVAAVDEVTTGDLADEVVLHPLDDTLGWERPPGEPAFERPATTADAIELVAAGIGLLVVPQSLARLHHRKDLTYRPVTDAPESRVALSWPQDATTDLVEDFIGIVRGRTVNSSRGRAKPPEEKKPQQKAKRTGTGTGTGTGKPTARNPRGGSSGGRGAKSGGRPGKPRRRS